MKNLLLCLFILFFFIDAKAQCTLNPLTPTDIVFVKEQGSGDFSGTSWDNALDGRLLARYLRDKAIDGTVIYVAQGVYFAYYIGCDTTPKPRTLTFDMKKNIIFKGGYAATASGTDTLSTRDMKLNVTRLSGEFQSDGDATNNTYHVVIIEKDIEPFIEGFYISEGYAMNDSSSYQDNGGGILDMGGKNPIVRVSNMVIENNLAKYGGGVYFWDNYATVLSNVVIRNNTSTNGFGGGGIFAWGNFAVLNSTINGNSGHGLVSWKGDIGIHNSTVTSNHGNGIDVTNGQSGNELRLRVFNSTITNNTSQGIYMESHKLDSMILNLDNTLLINNTSTNSIFSKNIAFGGEYPINFLGFKYSIAGDSLFKLNRNDQYLLPMPVALDTLADNGGWGNTQALLDICHNPAVDVGDVDFLADPSLKYDQRGVLRDNPPSIGAFDGVHLLRITNWTGAIDSDWNNIGNWDNGIPMECSYVTIPSGLTNYPEINNLTNAVCDTIDFESGAEVGGAPYLAYNYVKSKLTIQSNRWYTLSAPLTAMYSGDFILSLNRMNPSVYMMKYQAENPETGTEKVVGQWSNPFNSLDVSLPAGMGFAAWVDRDPTANVVFDFPKLDSRYYFYDRGGNQLPQFVDLTRSNPGQFIFKDLMAPDKTFALSVDNSSASGYNSLIIGNPFLSHLDFLAFYNANATSFDNKFQIWKGGTSFESYIIDGDDNVVIDTETGSDGGVNGLMIPPMQSILVTKSQPFTQVAFTPGMSVTQPGSGLRSALPDTKINNVLKLSIRSEGKRQSGIAVRLKKNANNNYQATEDVWTAFPNKEAGSIILYSLIENHAASINTLNDQPGMVELGIQKKTAGRFTLDASGLDHFDIGYSIYLEDRKNNKKQDLRTNTSYEFDADTGVVSQRFYLLIEKSPTSIDDLEDTNLIATVSNQTLHIESSSDNQILGIEIIGLQGQIVSSYKGLNHLEVLIPLDKYTDHQAIIVRIYTNKTTQVRKFVL